MLRRDSLVEPLQQTKVGTDRDVVSGLSLTGNLPGPELGRARDDKHDASLDEGGVRSFHYSSRVALAALGASTGFKDAGKVEYCAPCSTVPRSFSLERGGAHDTQVDEPCVQDISVKEWQHAARSHAHAAPEVSVQEHQ